MMTPEQKTQLMQLVDEYSYICRLRSDDFEPGVYGPRRANARDAIARFVDTVFPVHKEDMSDALEAIHRKVESLEHTRSLLKKLALVIRDWDAGEE